MRTLIAMVLVGLLTALFANYLSWWWCGIIAFLVTFGLKIRSGQAFLAGFFGVALAWGVMSGWMDVQGGGLLSRKIGELFGGVPSVILVVMSALLGGLIGGFGGMTGNALANVLRSAGSVKS